MNTLLVQGNAGIIPLPSQSVHCVVLSPPYWALRSYAGAQEVRWPAVKYTPLVGLDPVHIPEMCTALGLESDPYAFIGHMVAVFREIRRVLRDDGTVWLNMGDSYVNNPGNGRGGEQSLTGCPPHRSGWAKDVALLDSKNLLGIPWRLAFALQADGWYLRSDVIWHKSNPMPESVQDRPTKAHEYLFLLAKSQRYFYDGEAIKEPLQRSSLERGYTAAKMQHGGSPKERGVDDPRVRMGKGFWNKAYIPTGRNKRTVWTVATGGYSGEHYAAFPPALVEPCIKAGTSAHGVCALCGAPWVREVERGKTLGWRASCKYIDASRVPALVLDPCAGTGTTGIVCQQLRRRFVGLDISREYLRDDARRRLGLQVFDEWLHGKPVQEDNFDSMPLFSCDARVKL